MQCKKAAIYKDKYIQGYLNYPTILMIKKPGDLKYSDYQEY